MTLFISGYSFCRNALELGYPIIESIRSVLPICDEFIVADGNSDDGTLEALERITSDKIRIIKFQWKPQFNHGEHILAQASNYAIKQCRGDWIIGLQADEVLHNESHSPIQRILEQYKSDVRIDGFALRFLHFFGSYDFIRVDRKASSHEVRIIRGGQDIISSGDSQGYSQNGRKIRAKELDIKVFHYNRVAPPEVMQRRRIAFKKFCMTEEKLSREPGNSLKEYNYQKIHPSYLKHFNGEHPSVMRDRMKARNWEFRPGSMEKNKRINSNMARRILDFLSASAGIKICAKKTYRRVK